MEDFPVQVIGTILSHIAAVKQVVRASGTCRKPHRLHASVLDRIGKMSCLQILELFRIQVMGVEFTVQIWPSLVSLIL
ncbi:unnamed protein product [Sphagnum jensenii]|uniref:Uncharacterized protein n=1 Tax=Sphagnum jensenii TaxID=128206 RepID=A0ABP0VVC0_9BRYO